MPEIRELLHDAAPPARPYDEERVRGRVDSRRRRRRVLTGGGGLAVVLVVVAAALAFDAPGERDETVIAQPAPTTGGKVAGITAVAFVHDDVWVAYEGGDVGPEGGAVAGGIGRTIGSLHGDDEQVWALAEDGRAVAAIGIDAGGVHVWEGEGIADIEPLGGGRVAVSSSGTGEVVVLELGADGLEEIARIPVAANPTNLVRTLGDELWVNDGDVIRRIDWAAATAGDEQPWSGALLAPSSSGGIWTTDGERIVDLFPENLSVGASVAQGRRYFGDGTMVVELASEVFVGGPDGLVRASQVRADDADVIDGDEVVSMASVDGVLLYVAGGRVHRFDAEVADQETSEEALTSMIEARGVAERFLREEMRWPDAAMGEGSAGEAEPGTFSFEATTATLGRDVRIIVQIIDGPPVVTYFWTFGESGDDGSVALGQGRDSIYHPYVEDGLAPELTVTYGDRTSVFGTDEAIIATDSVGWEGDLGFVPDTPGWVQIVYRDANGVVLEGLRTSVPAGPFAAG